MFNFAGSVAIADPTPPTQAQIDFGVRTADLMQATMFAALGQEFSETTPQNVLEGNLSISLIFNNANRDVRLIGTLNPLGGANNLPSDNFEVTALADALSGTAKTSIQFQTGRWFYRRSIPLNNNISAACALCHANFPANQADQWVGALMLKEPVTP